MTWRDKVPEIAGSVFFTIIMGVGSWLIIQTYEINRSVGSLDAKLSENTGRLDRIAMALPEVRIRIAKEELAKPIVTAVVAYQPEKLASDKWVTGIHVINTATITHNTYLIPAKGPLDKEVAWLVGGAVYEADSEALSFKTLSEFSSDVGAPMSLAPNVNEQNSFVLRKPSSESIKALNERLQSQAVVQQTASIKASIMGSWDKLVSELKDNSQAYEGRENK